MLPFYNFIFPSFASSDSVQKDLIFFPTYGSLFVNTT